MEQDPEGASLEPASISHGVDGCCPSSVPGKGSGSKQSGHHTLWLGHLSPLVAVEHLRSMCEVFGPVVDVKVVKDKASGNGAGFGFVTFRTAEAASTALRHLNGADVDGCNLRVNYAFQGGAAREDTSHHYHIFVGDLGTEITDGVLYSTACRLGDCSDARVMWDHATGRSKGYGFISYRNQEDAERAITQLNECLIGGRRIRAGWAKHKHADGPTPDIDSVDRLDPFNTNVYVGNTPPGWTEKELVRTFSAFGQVLEVKLHKKGAYGFVRYAQHADAVKAIVGTHGATVNGRMLKCSWGKAPASALPNITSFLPSRLSSSGAEGVLLLPQGGGLHGMQGFTGLSDIGGMQGLTGMEMQGGMQPGMQATILNPSTLLASQLVLPVGQQQMLPSMQLAGLMGGGMHGLTSQMQGMYPAGIAAGQPLQAAAAAAAMAVARGGQSNTQGMAMAYPMASNTRVYANAGLQAMNTAAAGGGGGGTVLDFSQLSPQLHTQLHAQLQGVVYHGTLYR